MESEGNDSLKNERVESLRQILQRQWSRRIGYNEALEFGDSLIAFYEALGEDRSEPAEITGTKVERDEQGK